MGNTRKVNILKRSQKEGASTESTRKIVAIMFTDVAGFSSMMSKDEESTLKLMALNKVIQKSLVSKYKGRWIKEMGDGYMSTFDNASDAVRCARQIVEKTADEPSLKIKIGVHLAEIVVNQNDIHGDGVNIAARIVDDTSGGEIHVSESVFNNLRNKPDLTFSRVAERWFKNIDRSITIFRLEQGPRQNNEQLSSSMDDRPKVAVAKIECAPHLYNQKNHLSISLLEKLVDSGPVEVVAPSLIHCLGADLFKNTGSLRIKYLIEAIMATHDNQLMINFTLTDVDNKSIVVNQTYKIGQNESSENTVNSFMGTLSNFFIK